VVSRPHAPIAAPRDSQGRINAHDESPLLARTVSPSSLPSTRDPKVTHSLSSKYTGRYKDIAAITPDTTFVIDNINYPLRAYSMLYTPNDPIASQWWSSSNDLRGAWDITTGSADTTIAVIDTGFALSHEEFAGRWYRSPGETGPATSENASLLNCTDRGLPVDQSCNRVDDDLDGTVDNEAGSTTYQNPSQRNCTSQSKPITKDCNLRDDDLNGFVDDVTGWDFMNYDNSVQAGQLNPSGTGTTHGTMTAGVAAATGNNGTGIAGVNWQTKILPIQAIDDDGYGDTISVGQSILYATSQHVDVISLSLGSAYDDPYVRYAVDLAEAAGIVVVAASGNDGCDCISYPANYPEVVAVGAIGVSGTPASFSSWGSNLDMLAPGVNITAPTWSALNAASAYASGVSGTSFAAPYVAGVLSLLKSQQPQATPLQLISALSETARKTQASTATPRDTTHGFGTAYPLSAVGRLASARHAIHTYEFVPAQAGTYLNPGSPTETSGTYRVIACPSATAGLAVYELAKGSTQVYTISEVERTNAIAAGYTSSVFAYQCLLQANDTYDTIRSLDVPREFRNQSTPKG
jgi:subtilisin family serine protease